jgi:hypothetical protein
MRCPGCKEYDSDCHCRVRAQAWGAPELIEDGRKPLELLPKTEVRVVDPTTGGEKGSKLARFDLVPAEFEWALAEHYGRGAKKYADRNWERGYRWSLSYAALRRHLNQWWAGEDIDPETGSSHLIAVAWHAIALFIYQLRGLGTDDRPKAERKAA